MGSFIVSLVMLTHRHLINLVIWASAVTAGHLVLLDMFPMTGSVPVPMQHYIGGRREATAGLDVLQGTSC